MVNQREVTQEEAGAFSENNNMMYFETSAKEGDNIDYVFNYAAEKLLEFYGGNNQAILKRQMTPNNDIQSTNFKEIRIEESPKKKRCCS